MDFHYFLLLCSFFVALLQCAIPFWGAAQQRIVWMQLAIPLARIQCLLVTIVFLSLIVAFLSNDFSFVYVAQNSNSHLPLLYRICAVWGGHEGSIVLWVFLLSLWTAAVTFWTKKIALMTLAHVIAVLGLMSASFLLFLMTLSNPFVRAAKIIMEGRDLNPLLQDPGLVFHPPLLYMGYVGFAVTFAFAISALLRARLDRPWVRWVRPWTLSAWCFLTGGIISGSWWAYRVLGWGGWWFWDPVENASLLPWLAGTALIHSLLVLERREIIKTWVILLAILTFALSLLGTFIVRSGILISVHAFAVDPWRGVFMLGLLALTIGAALLLYAMRIKHFKAQSYPLPLFSKDMLLIGNNILLSVAVFTILLGTLYPLMIEVLGFGKLSVGAPYFNQVFTPLAFVILFLMGVSYVLNGVKTEKKQLLEFIGLLVAATVLSMLLLFFLTKGLQWRVLLGLALALWIVLNTLKILRKGQDKHMIWQQRFKAQSAMLLAHLGVAVSAIGILLSGAYSLQRDVRMEIGDTVQLGVYPLKLTGVYDRQGPNYRGIEAHLQFVQHPLTYLKPQLRYYPASDMALSKPAINMGWWGDVYVALAEPVDEQAWALRFYTKPFIRWIWLGGLLMLAGGFCALCQSKKIERVESVK